MRYFLYILFLLTTLVTSYSQVSFEGQPYYYLLKEQTVVPFIEMPSIDEAQLKSGQSENVPQLKSLRFAHPFLVNISPEHDGIWENTDNGYKIWRIGIRSKNAKSLNLIFSSFYLNEGAKVFIYNPSMSVVYGAYDQRTNLPSGGLATSPVPGDEIIIELQILDYTDDYGILVIGQVSHDYMGLFNYMDLKDNNFGRSGKCNVDINCDAGYNWQNEKNAVARIIVRGIDLCTGTMVNNTTNDGTPYFLTANHCVDDSVKALNTIFCFDYESPYCDGPDGSVANTISGSYLRATKYNLDFTLLELINQPPYNFELYYAGWSYEETAANNTTTIHHPLGDVKKISIDNKKPVTSTYPTNEYNVNAHWKILEWDLGTTEGGSSGSPLFNQNHQLVGSLTGGDAYCGNSVNDYYAKFARYWDDYAGMDQQLKYWLDPDSSSLKSINAYIPGTTSDFVAGFQKSTSDIEIFDTVILTDNSIGDVALYKWNFGIDAIPQTAFTKGPHKVIYATTGQKTITLEIINGPNSDTVSDEILAQPVNIDDIIYSPFLAFPNPSSDWVFIEQPDTQPNYEITIYNTIGQKQSPGIILSEKKYAIDFTGFTKGLYIIKMRNLITDKINRITVVIN